MRGANARRAGNSSSLCSFAPEFASDSELGSYVRWLGVLPALLVALAMLAPAAVQAKLYRRGGEFILNEVTEGVQQVRGLAVMPDGGFVVLFHIPGSAAAVRRFDANAQSLGPDVQVNTRPAVTNPLAQLAAAPDGSVLVVWQQYTHPESPPYRLRIAGRFFDADLNPQGEWFEVSDEAGYDPAVAAVGPGQFVVVWEDNWTYSGRARLVSRSGMGKVIEVSDMQQENYFKVASRGDGSYWVVWHSEFSWIQGRGYRGEEPFAELPLIEVSGAYFDGPALCIHSNGDFALAWSTEPRDPDGWGENPVSYRRFGFTGEPLGPAKAGTPEIAGPVQSLAAVACGSDSELLVAWHEHTSRVQKWNHIWGRLFVTGDSSPAGEFRIGHRDPSRADQPAIAALGRREWLVAWTDCDGSNHALECDVFGQRFTSTGPIDCPSDCNRDGIVTIDEILLATRVALGSPQYAYALDAEYSSLVKQCLPADVNPDYVVTIDELVLAVRTALGGCP